MVYLYNIIWIDSDWKFRLDWFGLKAWFRYKTFFGLVRSDSHWLGYIYQRQCKCRMYGHVTLHALFKKKLTTRFDCNFNFKKFDIFYKNIFFTFLYKICVLVYLLLILIRMFMLQKYFKRFWSLSTPRLLHILVTKINSTIE